MPDFDLNTAVAVDENTDGLLQAGQSFDLSSAKPVQEIRAAKPGEVGYSPDLTPEMKAQAVIERSYKEHGEQVPAGLKADWILTSPQAQAATKTVLAPEYTVFQGIRGAIMNSGQYDLLGNILKGVVEPERTKKFYQAIPGTEEMPAWAHTIAGLVEDIAGTGLVGGAKQVAKQQLFADDMMAKVDIAADQFAEENAAKLLPNTEPGFDLGSVKTEIKNWFKGTFYRKATALQPEFGAEGTLGTGEAAAPSWMQQQYEKANLFQLLINKFKNLDEAGVLRIPKVGQAVQFTSPQGVLKQGIIKAIEGERALVDIEGKMILAPLAQIFQNVQPPARGPVLALKLKDGTVISDESAQLHNDIIDNKGVNPDDVQDVGFVDSENKYMPTKEPDSRGGAPLESLPPVPEGAMAKARELVNQKLTENVPVELKPLYAEAPKYKSAEEFVKANTDAYHSTAADLQGDFRKSKGGVMGEGVYLARNEEYARMSGATQADGNMLDQTAYPVKILTNKIFKSEGYPDKKEIAKIKKQGYEGIETTDGEIVIFNPKNVQHGSQLTDIWNKMSGTPAPLDNPLKTGHTISEGESDYYEKVSSPEGKNLSESQSGISQSPLKVKFKKQGYFLFPQEKVSSPADAAFAFKQLKNEAVERSYVIGLKGDVPISIEPISIGSINAALVSSFEPLQLLFVKKADSFYLVHNHPSGDVTASDEDIALSERFKKAYAELGIKYRGHIIIDDTKFGFLDPEGNLEEIEHSTQEPTKKVPVYSKYIEWTKNIPTKPTLNNPHSAFELVKGLNTDLDKNFVAFFLNSKNVVLGCDIAPNKNLSLLRIARKAATSRCHQVLLINSKLPTEKIKELSKNLELSGINLMDDISIKGNIFSSAKDNDVIKEPGQEYQPGKLPIERKQAAMQERLFSVEDAKSGLEPLQEIQKEFLHRIEKFRGGYLGEELKGIPAKYITTGKGVKPDEVLEEMQGMGIDIQTVNEIPEYFTSLDDQIGQLKKIIEFDRPKMVRMRETTLLKKESKASEQALRQAAREKQALMNQSLARISREVRTGKIKTMQEIKKVQTEFVETIEASHIDAEDKTKFMRLLKNIQTPGQLESIIPEVADRIQSLYDKSERIKLVQDIKDLFSSQPTKGLPLQYKDQIEAIKDQFIPRQLSAASREKIESLRQFIKRMEEEGEEIDIPEYKLALLEKKSLDQLDSRELQALKEGLEQLYHNGRLYSKLLTAKTQMDVDLVCKKIVLEATKYKGVSNESSFVRSLREKNKSLKNASLEEVKNYLYANLRPELMMNLIGKEATETIFNPLNAADTAEITESGKSTIKLWDTQKEINIPQAWVKKYDVGKFKGITKNNALFIYANSQNEAQLAHLYASGLTDDDIELISNSLTPGERRAVENLWDYYQNDQWPRLDKIYSEMNGVHLNQEENYFPIMNLEEVSESYSKELQNELMQRFHLNRAGVQKGFTKQRMNSKKAFESFDYFGTIVKNHEYVEHYMAFSKAVRDANRLLRNSEVRAAIKQKFNGEYLRILDNWLKDVAYGGERRISNMLDRMAQFYTGNYITSVLGYNVISASKSLVSFLTGVDQIGTKEVVRAMAKFMYHPIKMTQFVYSKSEMMVHRDFTQEKEFKEILAGRQAYLGQAKLWQKFKEWSSVPMMISDRVTVIPLWMAAYQDYMDKGNALTNPDLEQEAIAEADRQIRRTQPMGRPLHLPDTFRGGAFQRCYTLFTNQLNQNFNREYEQTKKLIDKEITKREWIKTQVALVILSGLLIGMISRRRLPTAKELAYDSISQVSGGLFLIGNVVDAIALSLLTHQKRDVATAMVPKSFGALTELGKAATSRTWKGRFKHLTAGAGALTGFPYIQGGRILQTLDDVKDYMNEELNH